MEKKEEKKEARDVVRDAANKKANKAIDKAGDKINGAVGGGVVGDAVEDIFEEHAQKAKKKAYERFKDWWKSPNKWKSLKQCCGKLNCCCKSKKEPESEKPKAIADPEEVKILLPKGEEVKAGSLSAGKKTMTPMLEQKLQTKATGFIKTKLPEDSLKKSTLPPSPIMTPVQQKKRISTGAKV